MTAETTQVLSNLGDLSDKWVLRDGRMSNEGDARLIDALISNELTEVAVSDNGWRKLFRHRKTGCFWELSYPHSELPGGGPRRLRELVSASLTDC